MAKQKKASTIFFLAAYFLVLVVFLSFCWRVQRTILFVIPPSFNSFDDTPIKTTATATVMIKSPSIEENVRMGSSSAETNISSSLSLSSSPPPPHKQKNKQNSTKLSSPTTTQVSWTTEQTQYIRPANWTNMTYWREGTQSKRTPSGWWPDAQWVKNCVSHPETFDISPFPTLNRFTKYRLGDCVRFCQACVPKTPAGQQPQPQKNKETIAGRFFERACLGLTQGQNRWDILNIIVDEFGREDPEHFTSPDPNAILVHLRLGDKLEDSNATVYEMLQDSAEPLGGPVFRGLNAIKSVYEILAGIVESGARTVILRGGSHFANQYQKSKLYAYCLNEAVLKAGYNTSVHLDEGNPDWDFYFLSHAKKAIISVGGYSQFVGQSVLSRGGIVYGRVFGSFANETAESKEAT